MKHIIRPTLALVVCVVLVISSVPLTASAESYRLQYSAKDPTEIVGYVGTLPQVLEIPSGTTSIAREAFRNNGDIRKVIFPDSVTTIKGTYEGGCGAFRGCANLEEVVLGSGIRSIERTAFADCPDLKTINLPEGLRSIGMEAFQNCVSLHGIQIPSSVTVLDSDAFRNSGITQATVSNSQLSTGIEIFKKCLNLETAQFNGPELSFAAFEDCTALKTVIIGDDVKRIEHYVFAGCTNLTEVKIGSSVESIGNDAFNGCSTLKNIVLPEGLRELGPYMFKDCTSLEEIYIPASITRIQSGIIGNCRSLKRILFGGSSAQWDGVVANVDLGLKEMEDFEVIFNVPAPVVNIPPIYSVSITNDGGSSYATGIPAGTKDSFVSVGSLISALKLPEGASAVVRNANGVEQVSDAPLATGFVVDITGADDLPGRLTVVVTGDVLGTGTISLSQVIAVAKALTGQAPLTGPYFMAADFDRSGKIDITDLIREVQLLVR